MSVVLLLGMLFAWKYEPPQAQTPTPMTISSTAVTRTVPIVGDTFISDGPANRLDLAQGGGMDPNPTRAILARGAANHLIPPNALEWRGEANTGWMVASLYAQNDRVVYVLGGKDVDRETFYRWLDNYMLAKAKELQ